MKCAAPFHKTWQLPLDIGQSIDQLVEKSVEFDPICQKFIERLAVGTDFLNEKAIERTIKEVLYRELGLNFYQSLSRFPQLDHDWAYWNYLSLISAELIDALKIRKTHKSIEDIASRFEEFIDGVLVNRAMATTVITQPSDTEYNDFDDFGDIVRSCQKELQSFQAPSQSDPGLLFNVAGELILPSCHLTMTKLHNLLREGNLPTEGDRIDLITRLNQAR